VDDRQSGSTAASALFAPEPFAGRRVAVIDDDPAVIAAMRTLFAAWGASVAGGESAAAVVAECLALDASGGGRCRRPDLVVADLRLADGGCGLEAVKELRAIGGGRAPALIVSGDTGEEARAAVAAAGFTLLPKPVLAATLQAAAAKALDAAIA